MGDNSFGAPFADRNLVANSGKVLFLCLAAVFTAFCLDLASAVQPPAETMIERSVAANEADYKAAPDFNYKETDRTPDGSKTFQIALIDGSPYKRLIAVNRHPLSPAEVNEEQAKQDAAVAQRNAESSGQRQRRMDEYERGRNRDHAMMSQLSQAFTFQLVGKRRLRSFDTYLLKAVPRPDYNPPNLETEALRGMQGELWLDQKTFQWVRVIAEVVRPVSIAGILARVEPGTRFELEKSPVTDNIWENSHFVDKSRAKILFLIPYSSQDNETYFDYTPIREAARTDRAGAGRSQP